LLLLAKILDIIKVYVGFRYCEKLKQNSVTFLKLIRLLYDGQKKSVWMRMNLTK